MISNRGSKDTKTICKSISNIEYNGHNLNIFLTYIGV